MNEYGLIGYPLTHSFSKKYFTDKFEREGLKNNFFELFPLEFITAFPALVHAHPNLKGLAVTIPYKEKVLPFLTDVDMAAHAIGAVNCIRIIEGRLTGFNTDVTGFERSIIPHLKDHHKQALVLGTGGSSRAIQYALKQLGIPFLLVTRNAYQPEHISYDSIDSSIIENYPIIINCTPVGMYPNQSEKPRLPYELLSSRHLLYDLVYNPEETLFLTQGKKYGAAIKNGYEMLVIQAEENWRIWNEQ